MTLAGLLALYEQSIQGLRRTRKKQENLSCTFLRLEIEMNGQ